MTPTTGFSLDQTVTRQSTHTGAWRRWAGWGAGQAGGGFQGRCEVRALPPHAASASLPARGGGDMLLPGALLLAAATVRAPAMSRRCSPRAQWRRSRAVLRAGSDVVELPAHCRCQLGAVGPHRGARQHDAAACWEMACCAPQLLILPAL
jgi:hypothetical protein